VGDSFARLVLRRLILVSIALLAAYPHATGQTSNAQPEVQYESSSVDFTTGETVFTKASLSDGPSLLTADEIRYNFITNVATANGNVTLTRGPQRLIAQKLIYQRGTASFTAESIRVGSYPFYVSGATASGTVDEISVSSATVTFRESSFFTNPLTPAHVRTNHTRVRVAADAAAMQAATAGAPV
jgi:lipopolysaccharide export system protein LptA